MSGSKGPKSDFARLKKALSLATTAHEGQYRKGASQEAYVNHPKRVCKAYLKYQYKTGAGVIASICHDLVEDTFVTLEDLTDLFGKEVAVLVNDLSKPPLMSSSEFASTMQSWSFESRKIKVCDIEDNIISSRELGSERRKPMLSKWKKFLNNLQFEDSGKTQSTREFLKKWGEVYTLCIEEQNGLK